MVGVGQLLARELSLYIARATVLSQQLGTVLADRPVAGGLLPSDLEVFT